MDTRDRIAIGIASVVGTFILLSLLAVFVLAVTDRPTGQIWDRVFDLVGVLSGGLVGFVAGRRFDAAGGGRG